MASAVPHNNNLELNIESNDFTDPFDSVPEIYGENEFNLANPDTLLLAENLATEARNLLKILNTSVLSSEIINQFQIELRKTKIEDQCLTFKMSLRIDPVLWFKHHPLNGTNIPQLYDIGSRYVEKVKSETEHYPQPPNEDKIERIPVNNSTTDWCHIEQQGKTCNLKNDKQRPCLYKHYEWCFDENRGVTGKCATISTTTEHYKKYIHTTKIDKDNKSVYQCRHPIIKLNRTKTFCLFHANPNFWIYENEVIKPSVYPYFIVAARSDATPVITLNPVKHCGNIEYVQTCDAWQGVLQTLIYIKDKLKLNQLPLYQIYINFEKWMQQKAGDPTYRDCHAHMNIVLTRQTIKKINELYESNDKRINVKQLFPSLVGSVLPPKMHRLDDAWRLIEYMNDHMTPLLIQQNHQLVRSISTLKEQVQKLTEENEHLRNLIFSPTQDAQQADELMLGTDADNVAEGINELFLQPECSSESNDQ